MATLVRFVISKTVYSDNVVAVFPKLLYNKRIYGNTELVCYAHIGQHSSCSREWAYDRKNQRMATSREYASLKKELEDIGYVVRVCKH